MATYDWQMFVVKNGSFMIKKEDVSGTVILYNSTSEVLCNINTYIDQVSKLYVIDNSEKTDESLLKEIKELDNIVYTSLGGNKGIALALNYAAQQALVDGYSLLLTMDDDTQTPPNMVQEMIDFWNKYTQPIGIVSGIHHKKKVDSKYRSLPFTLTSGNLISLEAYVKVGGFRDDLFIDHVDHEFGLRLNKGGYQVIELPSIRLKHRLGYSQNIKVGQRIIGKYGSHSPIRLYYFARNGVYLSRKYISSQPFFAWMVLQEVIKRFIKASFLQSDRKYRIKMLLKGIMDGWRGKLGKLNL